MMITTTHRPYWAINIPGHDDDCPGAIINDDKRMYLVVDNTTAEIRLAEIGAEAWGRTPGDIFPIGPTITTEEIREIVKVIAGPWGEIFALGEDENPADYMHVANLVAREVGR